jgi:hypothetical protein
LRTEHKRKLRRPGPTTRYFLRRLAQAQHDGRRRAPVAYTRALAEVIALFVLMPSIALFSIGCWVCLKVHPGLLSATGSRSALAGVLLVTFSLVLLGHLGLSGRLRRFRHLPEAARDFDTDQDREIAFWQKLVVTAVCGFAMPLFAILMMASP